jgi:hypothetical protein
MGDDEEYNLGNNVNTSKSKAIGIPNLSIARESLGNAKKLCDQYGHNNPALVRILIGHILPYLSCIVFYEGPTIVGTFSTICDEFYGEKINLGIDTVKIVCANPTSMLAMIEQLDFIVKEYSREMQLLPTHTYQTRVKLVFGKELDVNFWDERRLVMAARVQLLIAHMNMIIGSAEREIKV